MKKFLSITLLLTGTMLLPGCGSAEKEQNQKNQQTESAPKMTRQKTASGLEYEITKPGTGESPKTGQKVTVHYTGWLLEDGKKGVQFDSSVDRGRPFTFIIGKGQVIKGWDEGVATMKVGEKRTLIIPAALGYGATGAGALIPGNATLVFDVELLSLS